MVFERGTFSTTCHKNASANLAILTVAEGSIHSLHVFRTNDGWDYRALIRANEYDNSAFLMKCVRIIR
jgi:chorismate mutase